VAKDQSGFWTVVLLSSSLTSLSCTAVQSLSIFSLKQLLVLA
jgi:hypothetical protein